MSEERAGEGNLPRAPSLFCLFGTDSRCQVPKAKEGWGARGELPFPPTFS
jgi:hypothetical protein